MTYQTQQATEAETSSSTYLFSARELARLASYRAAIVAGFYNEELGSAEFPMRQTLSASSRRDNYSKN